jgi:4-hydroxythreonine-4-phosphate dehydrogenase
MNSIVSKEKKVKLAITHGDINGINYEIIIKAIKDNRLYELFTPIVYGLSKVVGYHRKNMGLSDFNYNVIKNARQAMTNHANIVNISNDDIKIEYGKSVKIAGNLAFEALERAVSDLKTGKVDVLVTAPINKSNIHSEKFNFPGHTEYLADRFGVDKYLMIMVNDNLRIATVTGHLPVKDIVSHISETIITEKLEVLRESLQRDFLIQNPKIAVLGLNPHAGDNGVIGDEDMHVINPAIIKAKKQGHLVYGPFPADGFFGTDEYKKYDAVLAMYHDQGLLPFKILSMENGVNFTAGLPIVRTSPDHGTAYDIAGRNIASPQSMRQAIYLALDIFENRKDYDRMNENPLGYNLDQDALQHDTGEIPDEMKEVQD